ncbi:hypothetical protein EYF80_002722 [Liparis tanakae]|uniref:Uncharacterized protein n=1 Tax=Liparis tanakae TaxID=230148 RepID=A0A4Z2JAA0_9TELE|nr:hypothetical protein EYF80_002722 [Liparis tanakae]
MCESKEPREKRGQSSVITVCSSWLEGDDDCSARPGRLSAAGGRRPYGPRVIWAQPAQGLEGLWKGRAEGHGVHGHNGTDGHFSLALPNSLSIRSGAAGNIHAVCLREARWRTSLPSTSMLRAKAVRSTGEADFGVGADGQGVARRGRGGELRLDAGRLRGQIPDGQCAGLASDNQCAAIRQQLTGADAVQLGHGALAARLADVPDLDTAFATSIDVTCGVADGNGANHFAVAQRVDLAGVAWNTRADQGVGREGHGLHLTVCTDVEGVSPGGKVTGQRFMSLLF